MIIICLPSSRLKLTKCYYETSMNSYNSALVHLHSLLLFIVSLQINLLLAKNGEI